MPLTATGVYGQVWSGLVAKMPTVATAIRQDPSKAIPPHNPMSKMLQYCTRAWVTVLTGTPISTTYTGVAAGTSVPTPVPITFTAMGTAGAQLISTLGWVGPSAPIIANALTMDIAVATAAQSIYQSSPCPGGGAGTSIILPNNSAPLTATAGLFLAALATNFQSEALFTVNDLKVGFTPQIATLMGALSGVYATMYASIITTAPIVHSGAASPSPLAVPMVPGKVL